MPVNIVHALIGSEETGAVSVVHTQRGLGNYAVTVQGLDKFKGLHKIGIGEFCLPAQDFFLPSFSAKTSGNSGEQAALHNPGILVGHDYCFITFGL